MGKKFNEAERQVLIAHIELVEPFETPNNTHYSFYPTTLEAAKAYFLGLLENWEDAYTALLHLGLILMERKGKCQLTREGRIEARQQRLDHPPIWYWYRKFYTVTARSTAYSRFCERLYGRDLCQSNFSDMGQINFLIQAAGLQPGIRALDLGCGTGLFAEYLSDYSGALVLGLDYVPEAIKQARERTGSKRDRMQFSVGNLDHLEQVEGPYDLITSIDTLYMPNDLSATLRKMHEILTPSGKMVIFYTEMVFDSAQPRELLLPGGTGLGKALEAAGLSYDTWDFSEATFHLMRRKRKLAEEMRDEFEREGNLFLYDHLIRESDGGDEFFDPGTANLCRYLYRIRK